MSEIGKRIKGFLLFKLLIFNCCLNIEMTDIHRNTHPEFPIWFHYAIIIIYYVQTNQVFTLELFWNRTLTMQSNCEAEAYRQEPGQSKIFSYETPAHYLNQVPQCSSLSRASLWPWHTHSLCSTFSPPQTICSMRASGWFWSTFSFRNANWVSFSTSVICSTKGQWC